MARSSGASRTRTRQATTRRRERGRSVGQATAGGMDFQHRVAAWVATRVLAEVAASAPWELPAGTRLESIHCETPQSIDDALVGTSAGGRIWIQSKQRLRVSRAEASPLADALDQCVRQLKHLENDASPLDHERDRFAIVTDQGGESLEKDLQIVLVRGALAPFRCTHINRDERRRTRCAQRTQNERRPQLGWPDGGAASVASRQATAGRDRLRAIQAPPRGVAAVSAAPARGRPR
jgi:hypothetical protein